MIVKTTKLSAFDGMELKEATFRKQSFPYHFHDTYSIGIIEHGIERMYWGDGEMLAHAHSVVIINPGDIHANSYFDNDTWKYRALYVNSEVMRCAAAQPGMHIREDIFFPQQIIDDRILYSMIIYAHTTKGGYISAVEQMLVYLVARYAISKPGNLTKAEAAITDAAHYLQHNHSDKIIIDNIAAQCRMDKFQFIRAFKKQTGLTPVSYMLLHRINKAKTLIAANIPITRVALETGFYDQSHFTHYFKKYIGISPLAYRKGFSIID